MTFIKSNWAFFIVGFIVAQKIVIFGEIYIGELLALFCTTLFFLQIKLNRNSAIILCLGLLWSFTQLISDFINNTPLIDSLKGVLAPFVFVLTLIFFFQLFKKNIKVIPYFLLGEILGELANLILFPTAFYLHNPWKWGVGSVFLGLFVVWFSFLRKDAGGYLLIFFLVIFMIVTLNFDARGMAIFPIVSYLLYAKFYNKNVKYEKKIIRKRILLVIVLIPFSLVLFNSLASTLFTSQTFLSTLSPESAKKYQVQASGAYGLLLGGRSELLVSAKAISDKPLLGHGSWAKDRIGYASEYSFLKQKLGYSLEEDGGLEFSESGKLIPAHSFIFGAFLWAGIFGFVFWCYIIFDVLVTFIRNMRRLPFYFFMGTITFFWSVFFSPFGALSRWSTAIFMAFFYAYNEVLESKCSSK